MRILKNENGVSIVQVLIAAAMMGGLALVMGKLGQNQAKMQRGAMQSSDLLEFKTRMNKLLASTEFCNKNLAGKTYTLNANLNPSGPKQTLSQLLDKDDNVVVNDSNKPIAPNVTISAINIYRVNENELRMQIEIDKDAAITKKVSFGASSITQNFTIDGVFTGDTLDSCYSDFQGAAAASCAALNGTMDSSGKCVDTDLHKEICAIKIEKAMEDGILGEITGCNKKLVKSSSPYKSLKTSNGSINLSSDYIPGTLVVNLLGGGGGGGCGGGKKGAGGKAGGKKTVTAELNVEPGSTVSWSLGGGGNSPACDPGGSGGTTTVNIDGQIYSIGGGSGGSKKCGGDCWSGSGQSVSFMGTTYKGGVYKENSSGQGGQRGAGGAGGEKTTVDTRSGGDGGAGLVHIKYDTYVVQDT